MSRVRNMDQNRGIRFRVQDPFVAANLQKICGLEPRLRPFVINNRPNRKTKRFTNRIADCLKVTGKFVAQCGSLTGHAVELTSQAAHGRLVRADWVQGMFF